MRTIPSILTAIALAGTAVAQGWQSGPASGFRLTRFDGEYFPGTGMVYFLGGRLSDASTNGSVWSFDPQTSTYADVGVDMLTAISNYDVCLLRDDYNLPAGDTCGLYIVTGRNNAGGYTDAVQVYYPISNTVRTVTTDPFPGRTSGEIPVGVATVVADNMLYLMGGFSSNNSTTSSQTWVFDPLGTPGSRWTRLRDLSYARSYIAGAMVDSFMYAIGGDTYDGLSLYARAQCQRMNLADTASGWNLVENLPRPSGEMRAFGFGTDSPYSFAGSIITAGRGTWPDESTHCFIYNTAANTWDTFPRITTARRNHAGALVPEPSSDSSGIPGIWIWGGRQGSDTMVLTSCEYYDLTPTGIAERPLSRRVPALTITPNPTRGSAVVRYAPLSGTSVIRVYDITGDLVHEDRGGSGRVVIDRRLPAGVYVVRLSQAGQEGEQKLVVTR